MWKIKFQLAPLLHWIRMSPTLFPEMSYCFLFGISHHVFWWGITIYGGNEKQCWISSHGRRLDGSHCFSEGLWFIIPVLCWTLSIVWDAFKHMTPPSVGLLVITPTDFISSFLFQHSNIRSNVQNFKKWGFLLILGLLTPLCPMGGPR